MKIGKWSWLALALALVMGCSNQGKEMREAARTGNLEPVKALVEKDPELVKAKDRAGLTPLHLAAAAGHLEICAFLLDHAADPSAQDKKGETPLLLAALNDRKPVFELLVGRGAQPDIFAAAAMGDLESLKPLLKEKPDLLTAANSQGDTPLHLAAQAGRAYLCELLLLRGAEINAQDREAWTPLMKAAAAGQKEVCELLLKKGADSNLKNNHGETALDLARKNNYPEVATLLANK